MSTKRELKVFLEKISAEAKFTKFSYTSAEIFTVLLKCKVEEGDTEHYNNYTKEWIRRFSGFTNTTWIVHNCFPNMKRLVYRKSFWCHRSNQNKSKTSERTKNLNCRAKIDFKIKIINRNTTRKDLDLRMGLNMNISIEFNHSHLIRHPKCLSQLRTSSQADSAFYEYFNDGYSPSMAKCYHELLLTEQNEPDSGIIENASVNPTLRHIIYIFQKKRTQKTIDTNDVINRKIETLQKSGHIVKYSTSNQFAVIITPLMGRVVTEFSIESVLIDVTPIHTGPFVMMVFVPTPLGSLPIACVIFNDRNVGIYEHIFLAISSAIETGFAKRFEPKLVSFGNTFIKEALTSMFPRIVVKPDRFEICREFWEFICDDDNKVEKSKRHEIMQLFKSLIYSDNIEEAITIHYSLVNNDIMQPFLQKMESVWQDWEQWMGVKDFNGKHIEAPIIFIKEFFIQKCKSFNLCVMMDVVTKILESHFQKMIIAYINNDVVGLHTKFLSKIDLTSESIHKEGPNDYIVAGDGKTTYHLNTDSLCCDCKVGVKGRICEHLTSVLNTVNYKYNNASDSIDTDVVYKIAGEVKVKVENDNREEMEDCEMPFDTTDRPMSASSNESDVSTEIKQEIDPLNANYCIDNVVTLNLKAQYDANMKALNDEFRRLNRLFKNNPNKANMETMARLAKELAKIRPVEETDFSNMFVQMDS
ncbi:uncharacterized protein LOC134750097 [Cydia strobilella]|uniref:uncharacterized protein LOC134750097 n=1 Tax=Cydia strobilella TaxID=1100964 RepID=UPI003004DECE